MCFACHSALDQGHHLTKEMRVEIWEDAHRKTIGLLFEKELIVVP
jgi:hypothetical protein